MKKLLSSLFLVCCFSLFSFEASQYFETARKQGMAIHQVVTHCQENNYKFYKIKSLKMDDCKGLTMEIQGSCLDKTGELLKGEYEGAIYEVYCYKTKPKDTDAIDIDKYFAAATKIGQETMKKMAKGNIVFTVPLEDKIILDELGHQANFISSSQNGIFEQAFLHAEKNELPFFLIKSYTFKDEKGNVLTLNNPASDEKGVLLSKNDKGAAFEIFFFKNKPAKGNVFDVAEYKKMMKQVAEMLSEEQKPLPPLEKSEFIQEISSLEELKKVVKKSKKPVYIDFYSENCPPCRKIDPMLTEYAKEYHSKITFLKANAGKLEDLFTEYNIRAFPTLLIFEKGELKDKKVGLFEISDFIKEQTETKISDSDTK